MRAVGHAPQSIAAYIRPNRVCSMEMQTATAASMRGMDRRAQRAVESLREALPRNPATVAAYVTGSQARGTATERSDLDIYHIVRGNKWNFAHWDTVTDAVGDIIEVDVIVDSMESLGRSVNMYGSFEYWAIREGVVAYSDGSADWRAVRDMVQDDVCLPDCAPKWLEFAERCRNAGDDDLLEGGSHSEFACIRYRRSVLVSIMAALTHDNVRFPHMRRLTDLAEMMRDGSVVRGHDLGLVDGWVPSALHGEVGPTAGEVRAGARMARSIYDAARKYMRVI